jgi:4-amino-4-deoxy-L-arabinose transferase-like glycosyltransferase
MENIFQLGFLPQVLLYLGVGFLILSLYFFFIRRKTSSSVIFLFLSGLSVRLFMSFLDPWLNGWDEVYHALVAKNMAKHPLLPTLYDEPLFKLGSTWVGCHVWLHKQPLFLWQMASSIKLFGNTVFAARLPSEIMSALSILIIYDIGRRMLNKEAGYFSALVYAFAYFPLELACGAACNDHNDTAFIFYITASIWAWMRYIEKPSYKRAILVGVFAGCAILVKWLAGLLVFAGWGVALLQKTISNKHKATDNWQLISRSYLWIHLLIAFLVSCLLVLPWQLYIFHAFPYHALDEMSLNSKHFTEVVENHGGPWHYHFDQVRYIYASFNDAMKQDASGGNIFMRYATAWILLICLIFLLVKLPSAVHRIFVLTSILVVYIFFSLAATKMMTFTYIVSPLIFIAIGNAIYFFYRKDWTKYHWISAAFTLTLIYQFLYPEKIASDHLANNKYQVSRDFVSGLKRLEKEFDTQHEVLFNLHYNTSAQIQYFTNIKCYTFIPWPEMLDVIVKQGYRPVVWDNGHLPEHIFKYPGVRFIKDVPWENIKYD